MTGPLMLRLAAAMAVAIVMAPALTIFLASLGLFDPDGTGISLAAYHAVFIADPVAETPPAIAQLLATAKTAALGALTVIFAIALGAPLGFLLARKNFPGRAALDLLHIVPLLVPPYVTGWAWLRICGAWLGDSDAINFTAAAWSMATAYFPFVTLFAAAGFRRIAPEMEDAARLAGGRWFALSRVTLPLSRPWLTAGAAFVFLFAIRDFGVPALFRLDCLALDVYARFETHVDFRRFSHPAAQALPLVLLGVAALAVLWRAERRMTFFGITRAGHHATSNTARESRMSRASVAVAAWGLVAVAMGIPIGQLVADAFAPPDAGPIARLLAMLGDGTTADAITRSLETAAWAGLMAGAMFGGASVILAREGGRFGTVAGMAATLPLAVPGALLGIGWLFLSMSRATPYRMAAGIEAAMILAIAGAAGFAISHAGTCFHWPRVKITLASGAAFAIVAGVLFAVCWPMSVPVVRPDGFLAKPAPGTLAFAVKSALDGPLFLAAVNAVLFAPFVFRLVGAVVRQIGPEMREAATMAGFGPARGFLAIEAPLVAPGMAVAMILVFVLSAGEISATILVAPPGQTLVAPRLYNLIHYGQDGEVAVLCLFVAGLFVLPYVIAMLLLDRRLDTL